ncbi:hypothetical protein [Rhodococcus sp. Q]|uniref:hypothetical protein n=1 Tax=Rhodococcus sp. Q TaxID=2502252 RepID=UPI0010F9A83E|nr:hypothetical protein [Rhodococcus sp. Q]
MMIRSTGRDRCLTHVERPTRYAAGSNVIDSELEPDWVHINGVDHCPACVRVTKAAQDIPTRPVAA